MKKIILGGIFLSLAVPMLAVAAEPKGVLYFSAPQSAAVGQNLTVVVMADPKGQLLDTARAVVTFSKDTLEVKSVVLSSTFSVADPDSFYNNTEGVVSYAGGIPGGTSQLSSFATITFMVKKSGNATIAFDGQSIMLSGGVNMLYGTGKSLAFTIAEPSVAPPPVVQEAAKPVAAQNNSQPKPSAKAAAGSGDATAALEVAIVPVVGQAPFGVLNYLIANPWFSLFWLLVAVNIVFMFRKRISGLVFKYKFAVLVLVAGGLVFGMPVALAATSSSTVVYPSKEAVTVSPGKSVKKSLLIVNSSNAPITLKVSVRDVKPLDQSGGITFYKQEGDFPASGWLFPQYEVVTVTALNSQKMEYIVSAGKDMPGRGYAGAIVFELYDIKNKKTAGEPFGTLINLNVLAKGITTGGVVESFNSSLVQFVDPVKFNFTVKNPSNSNLSLAGNAVFNNLFGKEVGRFKTGQLDVYPGATRNFKFEWSDAPIFGIYTGNVTLVDSLRKDNIISSRTLLIFLPWQKLLVALLCIAVVLGGIVLLQRAYVKKKALNISARAALAASGKDMLGWPGLAISFLRRKAQTQLAKVQNLPILKK